MSDLFQSLSHSKWDYKYHVVFVPKRRRRVLFVRLRRQLGPIFHALAQQKECKIVEGHLMPDHVHMCIAIPPKYPGRFGNRVSEREECHCGGPTLGPRAQLHGRTSLGSRLCGFHRGLRTGAGQF
jgi:hypothetical protein